MPQQSRLIFWLLLAATLAVDVVATSWIFHNKLGGRPSTTFFIGLAFGQLSVLCAWAVLYGERIGFRWLAPFAAGAIVGGLLSSAERGYFVKNMITYTGLMWAQAALALPALWLLRPFRFVSGISHRTGQSRWQFGTRHLLALMTCLAGLLGVVLRSQKLSDNAGEVVVVVVCNAVLLLAVVSIVAKTNLHIVLRLAASLGAALAIAIPCEWFLIGLARGENTFAMNLIQSVVIWAWLEVLRPQPDANISVAAVPPPEATL